MATGAHELAASRGLRSFRGWQWVRSLEFRSGVFGLSSGIGVSGLRESQMLFRTFSDQRFLHGVA